MFRLGLCVCSLAVMLSVSACNTQKVEVKDVSFPTSDGGLVHARLYGNSSRGVILAHGAVFNKESWRKQSELLARKDFLVLAIDFRGYGESRHETEKNALHLDVLAAITYLEKRGAERVSVVGGSMGGGAAARAAVLAKPDQIDRLILLAHSPISQPDKLTGRKLFIVSRGDGIRNSVQQQYEQAPEPKKLLLLNGNAHAQHIFKTPHASTLQDAIVRWLTNDN